MRNVPDVALTGDNVYVVYNNGSPGIFGGTSCAAPLWAGFLALVNQQAALGGNPPAGFINPAVYTIGKSNPNYTRRQRITPTRIASNSIASWMSRRLEASGHKRLTIKIEL